MVTGSVVKIAVNWFLVADPNINIYGAPIGTLASYVVMCVMNFVFMCVTLDKNPSIRRILVSPALSCAAMGAGAWAVYGIAGRLIGTESWMRMALSMLIAVGVAVIIYAIMAILLRAITKEDMKLIPGGAKIAKLLHMH